MNFRHLSFDCDIKQLYKYNKIFYSTGMMEKPNLNSNLKRIVILVSKIPFIRQPPGAYMYMNILCKLLYKMH